MTWVSTTPARLAATVLTLALTTAAALTGAPPAGAATGFAAVPLSSFDQHLLADINSARTAHGLRRLTVVAGTTDVAHGWTCHQAANRVLSHNQRLGAQLATHGSRLWTTYAENVGYVAATAGAGALFRAYMNSAPHRANILDPSARYVGIWSMRGGSFRWNTIDFVGSQSDSYLNSYGSARASC
jgi:uncharacterized protein YkwD